MVIHVELTVVTFTPGLKEATTSITTATDLRASVAQFLNAHDLYVALSHPGGGDISLLASFNRDRAWVAHVDNEDHTLETPDRHAYLRVEQLKHEDDYLVFRLDNGQDQRVHRKCTVSHAEALKALSYFAEYHDRDPALQWHHAIDLW
jgi:hypothetical protein